MALVAEEDMALDPVDVRLLRAAAVVTRADPVANLIEELRLGRAGRPAFANEERRGVISRRVVPQSGRRVCDTHRVCPKP
jgi:hypothetical protein